MCTPNREAVRGETRRSWVATPDLCSRPVVGVHDLDCRGSPGLDRLRNRCPRVTGACGRRIVGRDHQHAWRRRGGGRDKRHAGQHDNGAQSCNESCPRDRTHAPHALGQVPYRLVLHRHTREPTQHRGAGRPLSTPRRPGDLPPPRRRDRPWRSASPATQQPGRRRLLTPDLRRHVVPPVHVCSLASSPSDVRWGGQRFKSARLLRMTARPTGHKLGAPPPRCQTGGSHSHSGAAHGVAVLEPPSGPSRQRGTH